jgi:hypothetical protein
MTWRWIHNFDQKMRQQNRKVCLHLDNFSGHYIDYEPENIELVYFAPNLTLWVQPLDAGIIHWFKAHYRQHFCKNALEWDELGEENIYKVDLLTILQMAMDAWDNITLETIENCWKHAGIQRDLITIWLPAPTLTQQGWSIVLKFASASDMSLPQAEAELQALFGSQYNDNYWRPALKVVTECEPDNNMIEAVLKLWESMSTTPPPVPEEPTINLPEYNDALEDLGHSIRTLQECNRIFHSAIEPDRFVELEGKEEGEEVRLRTDEEIIEEVKKDMAPPEEAIDETKDDSDEDELVSLAVMMDATMKLESRAPGVGGRRSELLKLCHKFRVELSKSMALGE